MLRSPLLRVTLRATQGGARLCEAYSPVAHVCFESVKVFYPKLWKDQDSGWGEGAKLIKGGPPDSEAEVEFAPAAPHVRTSGWWSPNHTGVIFQ